MINYKQLRRPFKPRKEEEAGIILAVCIGLALVILIAFGYVVIK